MAEIACLDRHISRRGRTTSRRFPLKTACPSCGACFNRSLCAYSASQWPILPRRHPSHPPHLLPVPGAGRIRMTPVARLPLPSEGPPRTKPAPPARPPVKSAPPPLPTARVGAPPLATETRLPIAAAPPSGRPLPASRTLPPARPPVIAGEAKRPPLVTLPEATSASDSPPPMAFAAAHPQGAEAERQTYPSSSLLNGAANGPPPPAIELSETEIILGVAKRTTLRLRRRVREALPSGGQWKVACVTLAAAAGIGFAVGRSSVKHGAVAIAGAASCPDTVTRAASPASPPATPPLPTRCVSARELGPATTTARARRIPPRSALRRQFRSTQSTTQSAKGPKKPSGAPSRAEDNRAPNCRGPGSPSGVARMTVTFQPSGDVKTAILQGGPFAGTAEGECIAGKFRTLKVPPFAGENVTVHKVLNFD